MSYTRRALPLIAAVVLICLAVVLGLLALDVRSWQGRMTRDDLRSRAHQSHLGLWRTPRCSPATRRARCSASTTRISCWKELQLFWYSRVGSAPAASRTLRRTRGDRGEAAVAPPDGVHAGGTLQRGEPARDHDGHRPRVRHRDRAGGTRSRQAPLHAGRPRESLELRREGQPRAGAAGSELRARSRSTRTLAAARAPAARAASAPSAALLMGFVPHAAERAVRARRRGPACRPLADPGQRPTSTETLLR